MCAENKLTKVLNVHWGFSVGGVAQYAAVMEGVQNCAPIEMSTVCILNRKRHIDNQTLARLGNLTSIYRIAPWDIRWVGRLRSIIKATRPHAIFTHGFNGHSAVVMATIFLKDRPKLIASYHGQYHSPTWVKKTMEGLYNGFTGWYMRRMASAVVSVAAVGKRYLISKGVSAHKISVIHNGIPDVVFDDRLEDLRDDLGLPATGVVIGVISRLEPIKGIPYLFQAFHRLAKSFPDSFLVIIGTGVAEDHLKRLAEQLDLNDRIRFVGFKANAARYMKVIDIFALPSLSEFHSIGLLEAMRAERAIIATDVGGNTESISNGIEGLVVRSKDVDELEGALRELLVNPELRRRLGAAARLRFEANFLVDVMVRRSAEFLRRAARQCVMEP